MPKKIGTRPPRGKDRPTLPIRPGGPKGKGPRRPKKPKKPGRKRAEAPQEAEEARTEEADVNAPKLGERITRSLSRGELFDLVGYEPQVDVVRAYHQSDARLRIVSAPARTSKSYAAAHDSMRRRG
jgi:hypothetical protein